MRSEQEANRAVELYADTVQRICMVHLKSYSDTQDIFQDVFLKYILSSVEFEDTEHEKAWLIRVTINCCHDFLKSFFRSHTVPIAEAVTVATQEQTDNSDVLDAVMNLSAKYRDIVYLYFYEGYSAVEISKILNKNVNTIYTRLARAKECLRNTLGGEEFE